jgi:hypothetical protein
MSSLLLLAFLRRGGDNDFRSSLTSSSSNWPPTPNRSRDSHRYSKRALLFCNSSSELRGDPAEALTDHGGDGAFLRLVGAGAYASGACKAGGSVCVAASLVFSNVISEGRMELGLVPQEASVFRISWLLVVELMDVAVPLDGRAKIGDVSEEDRWRRSQKPSWTSNSRSMLGSVH